MISRETLESVLLKRYNQLDDSIESLETDRRSARERRKNGEISPQTYRKFSRGTSLRIRLEQARKGEVNRMATMLEELPIPSTTTRQGPK